MLPTEEELRGLQQRMKDVVPDLNTIADFVLSVADKLPAFERETEHVALVDGQDYTFYHGDIASTDTEELVPVQQFERVVNEYVSPQSTAKWTRWHRDSYAVGALSRLKLNYDRLLPMAKETAEKFGLTPECDNPYMNTVAQVVECVQIVEHGLQLIDELLTEGIKAEKPDPRPREGEGVGCVEAPRGILFHRYGFDGDGKCVKANICIPTGQNHANIQKDFEELVPQILDQPEDQIRQNLEMLVRAYDPCISCSAHFLTVEFV